jgi:hypothetical protein
MNGTRTGGGVGGSGWSGFDGTDDADPRVGAVAATVSVLVLTVAFGLLALGVPYFWVAFPVGYGGLLPLSVVLARARWNESGAGDDGGPAAARDAADPVARVERAYVEGDVDEATFERELEAVLEHERGGEGEHEHEREGEGEHEHEREGEGEHEHEREGEGEHEHEREGER